MHGIDELERGTTKAGLGVTAYGSRGEAARLS